MSSRADTALLWQILQLGASDQEAGDGHGRERKTAAVHRLEALMELPILQDLQQALDSKDGERAASFYSTDALFVTSGRQPAEGRDAVQRVFEEDFRAPGFKLDLAVARVEVAASGDMAVVRGTFSVIFSTTDQRTPFEVRGSYLQVLRRDAEQPWRVAIDISTPTPIG
jgi:uncharacterized protein (TIGR02246 family)